MDEHEEQLPAVVIGQQSAAEAVALGEEWVADEVCAAAVDTARAALAEEVPPTHVGEPQGLSADGPLVVTHYFEGHVPGYTGWHWAVTVTRVPDSDHVTVDETALLPGPESLLAPAWVPWKKRIQHGDIGAGDVMVTETDDMRLIPGMAEDDLPQTEEQLLPSLWERGLGRERILSPHGLREAAHRWYREVGPRAAVARATDLQCQSCGFLVLIGGSLGQAFGVCANGYSPADGRVVALNFGCGAHSQTPPSTSTEVAETVVDEFGFEDLGQVPEPEVPAQADLPDDEPAPAETADAEADADETQADSGAGEQSPESEQERTEEDA